MSFDERKILRTNFSNQPMISGGFGCVGLQEISKVQEDLEKDYGIICMAREKMAISKDGLSDDERQPIYSYSLGVSFQYFYYFFKIKI
ncbi:unnamed protein product [Brugia pahangi]|uniref:Uncharacterized protein n=1 Tax=Brugia pahangi TaxID=6280 RepID=A0A0N4T753_BRUPA|nr:unnamed protein product [Brugia pahangi]